MSKTTAEVLEELATELEIERKTWLKSAQAYKRRGMPEWACEADGQACAYKDAAKRLRTRAKNA